MAAYQDKILVNDAITDNTKLDLSHTHITSANFMQISPIWNKEMVPGETIKCDVEFLSRTNPLVVPTFGRANIKNSAYFIPYRTIFRGWNDFITDAPHANSMNNTELVGNILNTVPYVTNKTLVQAFKDVSYEFNGYSQNGIYTNSGLSLTNHDIVLNTGSDVVYYRFNRVGQQILRVLESLGYKVQWNLLDDTKYSALPLLAFCKLYLDFYFPQDYTNTAAYNYLYMLCNADTGVPIELNKVDVGRILSFVYTCYDSDYFVSAWDRPNSPNTGTYSDNFKISNIDKVNGIMGASTSYNSVFTPFENGSVRNYSGSLSNGNVPDTNRTSMDAPFIQPTLLASTASSVGQGTQLVSTPISEYLLHGLHALTDYMKRHQLAGSAAFQRYLARFGKALSSEKLNRCVYLGTDTAPVQIGDVWSTSPGADKSDNRLGEYAGKSVSYGQGMFEYTTDEYGMFIIVSSIVPATGYYQGIDRNVKHLSKLDFWTPEFDNLGVQPITADELYMSYNGGSDFGANGSGKTIHNQIFGFTPRYAEYKCVQDQLTGVYRIPMLNGDIETNEEQFNGSASWHLYRKFTDSDFGGAVSGMTHGVEFCYGRNDSGQFNRIFDNQSWNAPDQFSLIYNFNAVSYSPMKSMYDTYEFEDKGKKQILQANGVIKN